MIKETSLQALEENKTKLSSTEEFIYLQIMIVFTDIYGNDFTQTFKI